MLNRLWVGFFWFAGLAACYQWLVLDNTAIFTHLVQAVFDMAKLSAEIGLGLIGVLCFWMGLFRLAEKSGLVDKLAWLLSPLLTRLMPGVPANDPAYGSMTMNIAANMLGLDNAATPLGLQAMKDLQRHNSTPDTATNAQILFLVINTSSVTLLPVTIFMYRAQQGAANPTDVFIPIILATTASTLVGIACVCLVQKIKLFQPVVLAYLVAICLLVSLIVWGFSGLSSIEMQEKSSLWANLILFATILVFITTAYFRKVAVYDTFIDGAKSGFDTAVSLIPYLVAMLVAIGVLRASGGLDMIVDAIGALVGLLGGDTSFTQALPTALMKPFSGSGARAMMLDAMATYGPDSFTGRLVSIVQGSTETTFYVLAVYFGVAGIKHGRHAIVCGLLADATGIVAAIGLGYWFFG